MHLLIILIHENIRRKRKQLKKANKDILNQTFCGKKRNNSSKKKNIDLSEQKSKEKRKRKNSAELSKNIKDKNNLSLFTKELSNQITNGNTIILPFIDPCYDLIEAYLSGDNVKIDIFKQLIENSFINRKNLIPIYAYFTELYSEAEK